MNFRQAVKSIEQLYYDIERTPRRGDVWNIQRFYWSNGSLTGYDCDDLYEEMTSDGTAEVLALVVVQ